MQVWEERSVVPGAADRLSRLDSRQAGGGDAGSGLASLLRFPALLLCRARADGRLTDGPRLADADGHAVEVDPRAAMAPWPSLRELWEGWP